VDPCGSGPSRQWAPDQQRTTPLTRRNAQHPGNGKRLRD